MRVRIKATFFLLLVMMAVSTVRTANAQAPIAIEKQPRAELALDYGFLRSNAPPGGCGCFNLNGGSATFAWPLGRGTFALAGDITVARADAISASLDSLTSKDSLTLSSYTAGARYRPRLRHSRLQPFGQVLAGFAHANGSLVEGQSPAASNASAAFAANIGGGLDLKANRGFSFRLVEADYLVTTFNNGVNDHQNNLRLSAGIVLHF
jgi:outer membrane immunogenic protein